MLRWGGSDKFFQQIREDTGIPHPADAARPALRRDCLRYFEAFQHLGASRMQTMAGPQPLQVSEIKAYLEIVGIEDPATKLKYLSLIQKMDRVELTHYAVRGSETEP